MKQLIPFMQNYHSEMFPLCPPQKPEVRVAAQEFILPPVSFISKAFTNGNLDKEK